MISELALVIGFILFLLFVGNLLVNNFWIGLVLIISIISGVLLYLVYLDDVRHGRI